MSYILDALKKAERERGLRQVPTIMTVHTTAAVHRNRLWIILGALVVCACIVVWFSLPSLRTKSRQISPLPGSQYAQSTNKPAAKEPAASTSAGPSPALPAPSQRSSAQTAELPSEKSAQPKITPRVDITRRTNQPTRPSVIAPPTLEEGDEEDLPPAEFMRLQNQISAAGINPPGNKLKPDAAQEKPATLTEALGKMKLSLLYYSDEKTVRSVFINGRKYREGDLVEGLYLLESITLEGATLNYQGERAILRAQPK